MKRAISLFLSLVMIIGIITGIPVTVSAENDEESFDMYIYMANYLSDINSKNTNQSVQLENYFDYDNYSVANILLNSIKEKNQSFLHSLEAWKVLTFEPSNITDDMLDEIGYYEAIIFSVVNTALNSESLNFFSSSSVEKLALSLTNSATKCLKEFAEIDYAEIGSLPVSEIEIDSLNAIKADTKKYLNAWDSGNNYISQVSDIIDYTKTYNEYIEQVANFAMVAKVADDVEAVLLSLYNNCPETENAMKTALYETYTVCSSANGAFFINLANGTAEITNIALDTLLDKMWTSMLETALGSFAKGALIGQAIGKSVSNFLFLTDKVKEQYYAIECVCNFIDLSVSTVDTLKKAYINDPSSENAKNYLCAIDMMFSSYELGADYSIEYADVVFKEGLVNSITNIFGEDEDYTKFVNSANGIKRNTIQTHTQLLDFDCYSVNLEVDYPEIYEMYYVYDKFTFIVDDGEATITGLVDGYEPAHLVVLPKYKGLPVTSIGDCAFAGCTNIETVTIPDSVTSIGLEAFSDCSRLTTIIIPDNVKTIGQFAFAGCSRLISVTIPDSITSIDHETFRGCTSLTSVAIPDSVEVIGGWAFRGCTSLTSITIPDSVENIGSLAFADCAKLTAIILPDNITKIEEEAFYNCGYYNDSRNWENEVLYIGNHLVEAKTSSGAYDVKDGTKTITDYAFKACSSLNSVTIPDGVTSIGDSAFEDCTKLTSITIPDSVISIGYRAFYNTGYYNNSSNWKSSVLYVGNHLIEAKTSLSGVYNIKDGTKSIAAQAFYGCSSLKSVTIPDSVTSISAGAFEYCENLTSVKIPLSITTIGDFVFTECINLTSISIPNGVINLGEGIFAGCDSLTSITIPNSVTSIGDYAFDDCTSLTSVTIPGNVTTIGDRAFGFYFNYQNRRIEKIAGFIIYGEVGSVAETYANENGFVFKVICEHKTTKWVTDKKATVNTVGSKHQECTDCGEVLKTAKIAQLKCATPKPIKVENVATGIKFTWNKVTGADNYEIYRKTGSGKWTKIATVKGNVTSYTDKTAKSGTTYKYSVAAKNEAGSSKYNTTGLSVRKLAMPTKITTTNVKNGITVKWGNVTGATGYYVMRKVGNGSWVKIATVKGTTYTDKTVKSGVNYKYTIKAYYGNSVSVYNTTGLTIKCLADPVLKAPTSTKAGITFKWGKVTGAQGYVVYRQTGNGKLTKIATVKGVSKVSYTDKSAKKGTKYTYKLKAYSGKTYSAYSNGKTIKDKY